MISAGWIMIAGQPRLTGKRRPIREAISTSCDGSPDYVGSFLLFCYDWLLGRTVKAGGDLDCLREGISLFGLVGTAVVALGLYIQKAPAPDLRIMILYVLSSAIPWICLLSVCMNCTKADDGTIGHAFRPAHRRIIWRLFFASAILVSYTGYSYQTGNFLNQGKVGKFLDTNTRSLQFTFEKELNNGRWDWIAQFAREGWKIQNVSCFHDKTLADKEYDFSTTDKLNADNLMVGHFIVTTPGTYYFLVTLEQIVDQDRHKPDPTKEEVSFAIEPRN
jgi:hypothetical protein